MGALTRRLLPYFIAEEYMSKNQSSNESSNDKDGNT